MQSIILSQLVYHGEVGLEAVYCKYYFEKILQNFIKESSWRSPFLA